MGRKIKRVAMDFDWPLSKAWHGYLCPYRSFKCPSCDGTGMGAEAKRLHDDWHDHAGTGRRWCDKLDEDDVQALLDAGRLRDLTHTWTRESGWQRRADGHVPTPAEVNAWAQSGMGHDGLNQWVCVTERCARADIIVECLRCSGKGHLWATPEIERLADEWTPTEPPAGDGWQVWETVGEGSPITPVLPSAEALARYLADVGDDWTQARESRGSALGGRPTYEQALAFVRSAWAPSMAVIDGELKGPYEMAGPSGD